VEHVAVETASTIGWLKKDCPRTTGSQCRASDLAGVREGVLLADNASVRVQHSEADAEHEQEEVRAVLRHHELVGKGCCVGPGRKKEMTGIGEPGLQTDIGRR
jgi:hypothetical protein